MACGCGMEGGPLLGTATVICIASHRMQGSQQGKAHIGAHVMRSAGVMLHLRQARRQAGKEGRRAQRAAERRDAESRGRCCGMHRAAAHRHAGVLRAAGVDLRLEIDGAVRMPPPMVVGRVVLRDDGCCDWRAAERHGCVHPHLWLPVLQVLRHGQMRVEHVAVLVRVKRKDEALYGKHSAMRLRALACIAARGAKAQEACTSPDVEHQAMSLWRPMWLRIIRSWLRGNEEVCQRYRSMRDPHVISHTVKELFCSAG